MNFIKKTSITLTVLLGLSGSVVKAQENDRLITYNLPQFTQLEVGVDTEFIILESTRNIMFVQGDSLTQDAIQINDSNGILTISSNTLSDSKRPTRIVFEAISLESLTTTGSGKYYIVGHKNRKLGINNTTVLAENRSN